MKIILVIRKEENYHFHDTFTRSFSGIKCNRVAHFWNNLFDPDYLTIKRSIEQVTLRFHQQIAFDDICEYINYQYIHEISSVPGNFVIPVDSDDFVSPELLTIIRNTEVSHQAARWTTLEWNQRKNTILNDWYEIARPNELTRPMRSNGYGLATPTNPRQIVKHDTARWIIPYHYFTLTCPSLRFGTVASLSNFKRGREKTIVEDILSIQKYSDIPQGMPEIYHQSCNKLMDIFRNIRVK